ncbi:uncharacterized protein F5891DRAFT_975345 [Suillus fuscotomentosus]|uniref:Uncharacterized protein n=1 Tax=Suillus fuscotomentosus TaxID=1912939 RepID=A0AAD4HQP3_9AGAM|nr:uncharacterized protein F5891DRAFT_975345 [Suillus fuscotomentosus]KAG1906570.1 hypothetical protein F5891DRAFT_975345 [Suillus fuscotomentosus]
MHHLGEGWPIQLKFNLQPAGPLSHIAQAGRPNAPFGRASAELGFTWTSRCPVVQVLQANYRSQRHGNPQAQHMPRYQVIALLLWLAYPSICLSVPLAFCLWVTEALGVFRSTYKYDVSFGAAIFIACFGSDNAVVNIITILACVAFLSNGALTLYVFAIVGRKPANGKKTTPTQVIDGHHASIVWLIEALAALRAKGGGFSTILDKTTMSTVWTIHI